LLYVAHSDGAAFQYVWSTYPQFNSMASVVAGSGVMVFGGHCSPSHSSRPHRFHPILHRMLIALIGLILGLDTVLWIVDPQLLKRILVYMILVSVLTFVIASLVAARTRFREVRFYVSGLAGGAHPGGPVHRPLRLWTGIADHAGLRLSAAGARVLTPC
jgi:hypothetical protein